MDHSTAERIASKVIGKERQEKWDMLVSQWTTNNDKASSIALLRQAYSQFENNTSTDNWTLLTHAMYVHQQVMCSNFEGAFDKLTKEAYDNLA